MSCTFLALAITVGVKIAGHLLALQFESEGIF